MILPFREWLLLQEAKSVGVIYHFTRLTSLKDIEDLNFCLGSHQHYISFTRNFDLQNKDFYKNDMSVLKGDDKRIVRIAIDGTALSNHYKIEPFIDLEYGVKRKQGEWEERVLKHGIKKVRKKLFVSNHSSNKLMFYMMTKNSSKRCFLMSNFHSKLSKSLKGFSRITELT